MGCTGEAFFPGADQGGNLRGFIHCFFDDKGKLDLCIQLADAVSDLSGAGISDGDREGYADSPESCGGAGNVSWKSLMQDGATNS